MSSLKPFAKSIVAFFAPGIVIVAGALSDGNPPSPEQWYMALGASLASGIAVYLTPNKPA